MLLHHFEYETDVLMIYHFCDLKQCYGFNYFNTNKLLDRNEAIVSCKTTKMSPLGVTESYWTHN